MKTMKRGFSLKDGVVAYGCHEKAGRRDFRKPAEAFARAMRVNPLGALMELMDIIAELDRMEEIRNEMNRRRDAS
jgi:hypothetical protein